MVLYNQQEKKMKIIPKAAFESQKDAFVDSPKVRSHRFPCKVMFLGGVCPPDKNHNIDGKVYLRWVSKEMIQKKQLYNQNFVPTFENNHELKAGDWHSLYPTDFELSVNDFMSTIKEKYEIDESVADDLVFTYSWENLFADDRRKNPVSYIFYVIVKMWSYTIHAMNGNY